MISSIAVKQRAVKDIRLVGVQSLRDVLGTYPAMAREAKSTKKANPYCFDFYNVETFFYLSTAAIRSVAARILNSLINALNDTEILPHFIVIFPDKDLVYPIKFDEYGLGEIIEKIVDWLVKEVEFAVDRKKFAMKAVKLRSVTELEPKIIWVKMMDKPKNGKHHLLQKKFNFILEETLAARRNNYIMKVDDFLDTGMFTRFGELNNIGRLEMLKNFDNKIKRFDKQELSLKPIQRSDEESKKFRLPPPPPTMRVKKEFNLSHRY